VGVRAWRGITRESVSMAGDAEAVGEGVRDMGARVGWDCEREAWVGFDIVTEAVGCRCGGVEVGAKCMRCLVVVVERDGGC
jgi:hypothetical protein